VNVIIHLTLGALALPAAAMCLYLFACTLLSRAPKPNGHSTRTLRFDIIVPAHDEAATIEAVLASLQRLDWPKEAFRIVVVADNCTDDTAARARLAGADVLERHDDRLRGKGYALDHGFRMSRARDWADAVVVVDADSQVSPNLLEEFSLHLESGAQAVQARYGVLNIHASWRTRLAAIALAAFHDVRSRARERLHLSCGLRGNGWCVTRWVLREVPHKAVSLAEDVEYGIALGIAGYRVYYTDNARVAGAMPSSEKGSRSQRRRWEDGRFQLAYSRLGPLLRAARHYADWVCLDLALDLLVLPLSYVALNIAILVLLAAATMIWVPSAVVWVWLGLCCASCLAAYVLRGWQLSHVGPRGLLDLALAPLFVLWKLVLMIQPHDSTEWIRTGREDS
jgi:cellulose synthase/poly-beta-1,6-N-acetylglucosamine synthase-like glycosyltransferase